MKNPYLYNNQKNISFIRASIRFITIIRICVIFRLERFLPQTKYQRSILILLWCIRQLLAPIQSKKGLQKNKEQSLRLALIRLGPIFVKLGQLLSTRVDLLSQPLINELSLLQDSVPPFSDTLAHEIIAYELGAPTQQLFVEFDKEVLASASIAQVYSAKLHSGDNVIVKVVRPGIEQVISCDITLMYSITSLITRIWTTTRSLHLDEVVRNYHHTIIGELDMEREASNCSQLGRNFTNSKLLYVPKIYWKYCSRRILTQEKIDGIAVNDIAQMDKYGISRKILAEKGVEIFFTQVFDHSFFHADMHPGNIFVMKKNPHDPKYVGVDFGIMGSLSDEDQYYLALNLLAFFNQDYRRVASLHVESGWVSPSTRVEELETAIRTVCEPIFALPLKEISFGKIITRLFQTARRFDMEVQPQLILLQKTLFHIEGLGRQLYPDLNLWETAKPFLERWITRRAGLSRLRQKMRQQAPEWIEKIPQIPNTIESIAKNMQTLPQIYEYQQQLSKLQKKQRITNIGIITLFIIIAIYLYVFFTIAE